MTIQFFGITYPFNIWDFPPFYTCLLVFKMGSLIRRKQISDMEGRNVTQDILNPISQLSRHLSNRRIPWWRGTLEALSQSCNGHFYNYYGLLSSIVSSKRGLESNPKGCWDRAIVFQVMISYGIWLIKETLHIIWGVSIDVTAKTEKDGGAQNNMLR